ncbi:hypothetical protein ACIQZI_15770 [Peribacillus sp. NPDC096379]|uniref:hypothetical protein n=1 Tax=Peribacillus sp. NPDC096379 TaxID=3364393 RepID=UPI003809E0E9
MYIQYQLVFCYINRFANRLANRLNAISIIVSPKHRMGLATSTYFIFTDLGIGIRPFILGSLVPVMGFRELYMTIAIVVFACLFLYYFLHGRKAVHGTVNVG